MNWESTNSLHEISFFFFFESYTSNGICLMRMTPERCIEHVRHPVPKRSGEKIASGISDHSLCLVARLLYLLVLRGIINERAEGTRHKIMKNTHTHKEKL